MLVGNLEECLFPTLANSPRSIAWTPPQPGWLKLNVDGASRGNPGLAGGGGVVRLANGSCFLSFSAFFGDCSALRSELLAIKTGLSILHTRCASLVILESDCSEAIKLMSSKLPTSHADFYLIKECQDLVTNRNWTIRLSTIARGANRVADTLANLSFMHLSNLIVFDSPPAPVLAPLEKDYLNSLNLH
ncbi:hypothetical protein V2J09_009155 [Rumex salicifolius]